MVNKISTSARVVLALGCVGLLVAGNGCSRMMSPPGQRLFGQNSPEPQNWNLPAEDSIDSPGMAQANRYETLPSNQVIPSSDFLSPQGVLDQQFAHSMKVPELTPPRLIPIESVEFPGDGTKVVTASATITDNPSSQEPSVALSEHQETEKVDRTVKQAVVSDDSVSKTAATAIAVTSKNFNPLSLANKDKPKLQQESLRSSESNVKPDYNRTVGRIPENSSVPSFQPHHFQAARRALGAQSSPSDRKELFAPKTVSPPSIAPLTQDMNPARLPFEGDAPAGGNTPSAKPSASQVATSNATVRQDKTLAEAKSSKANVAATSEQAVAPQPNLAKEFAKQAIRTSSQDMSGDQAALTAAGIKVDANAFEIAIPNGKRPKISEPPQKQLPAEIPVEKPVSTEPGAPISAPVVDKQIQFNAIPTASPRPQTNPASKVGAEPSTTIAAPAVKSPSESSKPAATGRASNSTFVPFQPAASPSNLAAAAATTTLARPNPSTSTSTSTSPATPARQSGTSTSEFKAVPQPKSPLPSATVLPLNSSGTTASKVDSNKSIDITPPKAVIETKPVPAAEATPKSVPKMVTNMLDPVPVQASPSANSPAGHASETKLEVVNSQFCTEIKGFGQVTPFPNTNFKGNQRTLVYCEVENYNSQARNTDNGTQYVTRFRGEYQIVNPQSEVVQSGQFPEIEDITVRKRRDFYLYFPITFKNLASGKYELRLKIQETVPSGAGASSRAAQQTLSFAIE